MFELLSKVGIESPKTKVNESGAFTDAQTLKQLEQLAGTLVASLSIGVAERAKLTYEFAVQSGIDAYRALRK